MHTSPLARLRRLLVLGLACAAGLGLLQGPSPRPVAAQNLPPEGYKRVGVWSANPQPRPPGEFTAAAGIDVDQDGLVYVADQAEHTVHVLSSTGQGLRLIGRPGTALGEFDRPSDVALGNGRLYVADTGNRRIQVFDPATGGFLTVWSNVGRPIGVAVGKDRVYVSDGEAPRVVVLDLAGVVVSTWGPNQTVGGQPFVTPRGMDVAPDGRVFVADAAAQKIFILRADGSVEREIGRNNDAYYQPVDVVVDGDAIYGVSWRLAFAWDSFRAGAPFWRLVPHYHIGGQGVAIGPGGGLAVTVQDNRGNFSGVEYHPERDNLPRSIQRWGTVPVPLGSLNGPRRLAARPDGGALILDAAPRVQRWDPAGKPLGQLRAEDVNDVAPAPGSDLYLIEPRGVRRVGTDGKVAWTWRTDDYGAWLAAGAAGGTGDKLWVLDTGLGRLVILDATGQATTLPLDGLPTDLAPGGSLLFVSDRAGTGDLRLLDAGGTEVRRWAAPGRVTRVAALRDGSAFFALTSDGWVWKYAPDGSLRAAWDGAVEGGPIDLDVDATGRVMVADGRNNRVILWGPGGVPVPPPSPGDRCDLMPNKVADPAVVRVGSAVSVTLSVEGDCPGQSLKLDVMLVIDRSGSMEGAKLAAAKSAATLFATEMDYAKVQLGLAVFSTGSTLVQPLTTDPKAVIRGIASMEVSGETDIASGLRTATTELTGTRSRPDANKVIVIMTDGRPSNNNTLRESDAARRAGVTIFAIGLGSDLDPALMKMMAGADDRYFEAPTEAELPRIFTRIARRLVAGVLLQTVAVSDVIPANMDYETGSAVPVAQWNPGTRTLTWQLTDVSFVGLKLTYRVRPQQSGKQLPTNVRADADYVDGVDASGKLVFPVPVVNVLGNQAAFLPLLLQNRCPEQRFDFVLAIDTSSSMDESTASGGETKMDAARRAAANFLDFLRLPGDQAAVVAFNTDASVVTGLTNNLGTLRDALGRLPRSTGTRIDRGLSEALAELTGPRHRPANLQVVILLTDGRPTEGTTPDVLAKASAVRRAGIVVFTIGLGADVDGGLLIQVAGDPGRYSYAPDQTSLGGIYRAIGLTVPCR